MDRQNEVVADMTGWIQETFVCAYCEWTWIAVREHGTRLGAIECPQCRKSYVIVKGPK